MDFLDERLPYSLVFHSIADIGQVRKILSFVDVDVCIVIPNKFSQLTFFKAKSYFKNIL